MWVIYAENKKGGLADRWVAGQNRMVGGFFGVIIILRPITYVMLTLLTLTQKNNKVLAIMIAQCYNSVK